MNQQKPSDSEKVWTLKEIRDKIPLWEGQKQVRRRYSVEAREARDWLRATYPPAPSYPDRQVVLLEDVRERCVVLTYYALEPVPYVVIKRMKPTSLLYSFLPDGTPKPYYTAGVLRLNPKTIPHIIKGLQRILNTHRLGLEHQYLKRNMFAIQGKKGGIYFLVDSHKGTPYYKIARVWHKPGGTFFTRDQFNIPYSAADEWLPKYIQALETADGLFKNLGRENQDLLDYEFDSEVIEVEEDFGGGRTSDNT